MSFLFWVKGIVACIYTALGLWLIFNPTVFVGVQLDAMTGRILGTILFLYGLFRMYNHYIEYKNNNRGEE